MRFFRPRFFGAALVVSCLTIVACSEGQVATRGIPGLTQALETLDQNRAVQITVSIAAKEETGAASSIPDTPDFHEAHDTVITCESSTDEGQADCQDMGEQLSDQGYACTSELGPPPFTRCESL